MSSFLDQIKNWFWSVRYWRFVSFFWGFLEATIFFIIPDVFISRLGLVDYKRALMATIYTLAGSLFGAVLLFQSAGLIDKEPFLKAVPFVTMHQMEKAEAGLLEYGVSGVAFGPLYGIPHKIYTLHAADLKLSLNHFLLYSALTRWLRFMLIACCTIGMCIMLKKFFRFSDKRLTTTFVLVWIIFYFFYIISLK